MNDDFLNIHHTYDHWKSITESDFVTLFIKTWFAFVATLRELYPDKATPYYLATGDSPFINNYKKDFAHRIYYKCDYSEIAENMHNLYKNGMHITCEKYPRFLIQDFYNINRSFKEQQKEEFESFGRTKGQVSLIVRHLSDGLIKSELKCTDKLLVDKIETGYIISSNNINYKDIIDNIIVRLEIEGKIDSETEPLELFYTSLFESVTQNVVQDLENIKNTIPSKGNSKLIKDLSQLQSFCLRSSECLKNSCLKADNDDNHKLLCQVPITEFLQSFGSLTKIQEQHAYIWFINYSYRLRNALFHEIIDPLDPKWQAIFKCAYMVLKQIVDANIEWLRETKLFVQNAPYVVEKDFRESPPPEIPIKEYGDASFITNSVELIRFNQDGAKAKISLNIDFKGIIFTVNGNVVWNKQAKKTVPKNITITRVEKQNIS